MADNTGNPWDDYAAPQQVGASDGKPWEDYAQQSKGSIGDRLTAAIGGVSKDFTFGGLDHFEAAAASLIPLDRMISLGGNADAKFMDYNHNLEQVRRRNTAQQKASPKTYMAGQVAGSIAGFGKLNAAKALPSQLLARGSQRAAPNVTAKGGGFLSQTAGVGLDAAVLGGAQAALEGRDAIKDAKQGAMSAMVLNSLMRGAAPIAGVFRKAPKAPDTSQIQSAKNAAYDDALGRGVQYSPAQIGQLADDVSALAPQTGLKAVDSVTHPMTRHAVDKLNSNRGIPQGLDDIDSFRGGLSPAAGNGPDGRLIGQIRGKLDSFIENTAPAKVAQGNIDDALLSIKNARKLHRRFKQSEALDEIEEKFLNSAAKKGGRTDDAIRSGLRTILNNANSRKQFDPEHLDSMRQMVRGNAGRNAVSQAGQTFNPLNRQNMAISGYGLSTQYAPLIAAANTLGIAGRATSNRLTSRDYKALAAEIRTGSGQIVTPSKVEKLLKEPELRGLLAPSGGVQYAGAN